MLGCFAWIELPTLTLIGLLWLVTGNWLIATQIAVATVVVLLPGTLFFVPLRPLPKQEPYPRSLGTITVSKPVVGPAAYVVILGMALGALVAGTYVLVLSGR